MEWEATPEGNVDVKNDPADFHLHAEFSYECVRKTIDEDLPRETGFLRRYDRFRGVVPERTLDLLFRFLNQNGGS